MEQNIADLLKDAFSEVDIDFEHLQSDEGTNTSQTQLVMDEDLDDVKGASKLWVKSNQGSVNTFTNVYEQEDNEESSDSSEDSESSNLFTRNTLCLSHEIDYDQVVKKTMTSSTAEEGSMQSDLGAGVSMHGLLTGFSMVRGEKELREEELPFESVEDLKTSSAEYQPQTSHPVSSESQTPEETSSKSYKEAPENSSTREQASQCKSDGSKDEAFLAMSPNMSDEYHVRDDMREFTEEDQEQIEESFADYPTDLSQSETEESSESATAQPSTLIDISFRDDQSTNWMEDMSSAENVNLQEKDSLIDGAALDLDTGIKDLEVEMISATADIELSFQRVNFDEEGLQESSTNYSNIEENTKNKEDTGDEKDPSDANDQADYDSDISSDDHSTSQEETSFLSSVKHEEECKHDTQHNYSTEYLVRVDNDIDCICPDTEDRDGSSPKKHDAECVSFCAVEERDFINTGSILCYEESNKESTELHHNLFHPVQPDLAIKDHDKSLSDADTVGDTKTLITEVLWSSALLMDEHNLCLDEYDWDLTGEELFDMNSGERENQKDTEEALEELDIDEEEEGKERDWELEKTRIEAFNIFYGDQAEPEDTVGRNQKVTFCLDHESSEYEEDSESTEQELDEDLNTPVPTLKPEYHSESDEPQEKPFYPERSRMQPKEQQYVGVGGKQRPSRNRCLAVLKSTLAFGLVTAIGMVSFWWATENLDRIH